MRGAALAPLIQIAHIYAVSNKIFCLIDIVKPAGRIAGLDM